MRSVQELIDRWWPLVEAHLPLPPDAELIEEAEQEVLDEERRRRYAKMADAE